MAVLKPPYQYVIDTSALIDLKNQYPESIFVGVWNRFNSMCEEGQIISPREVLREIKKGDDELVKWAEDYEEVFLEPTENEILILQKVMAYYPINIIEKYSTRPWADPLVIASAKHYGLTIIQQEQGSLNQFKIPSVAAHFGIKCVRLLEFFQDEGWQFVDV
jgi:hypothetical protein